MGKGARHDPELGATEKVQFMDGAWHFFLRGYEWDVLILTIALHLVLNGENLIVVFTFFIDWAEI